MRPEHRAQTPEPEVMPPVEPEPEPEIISRSEIEQVLRDSAQIAERLQPMVIKMVAKAVHIKQQRRRLGGGSAQPSLRAAIPETTRQAPEVIVIDTEVVK